MAANSIKVRNFIFCAAFIFLNACSDQALFEPDTLRIAMGAEPDTLNPILASDAYASNILDYVNDTLIDRNRDTLDFQPKLAERWEITSDHLQYIFHLRHGVHWQDGVEFTADDVVYSFQKINDPKVEAPFLRANYIDIDRVEKIDSYTVKFIYKRPYFLGLSVCGAIPLIPKHLFEDGNDFNSHPLNRKPIGLGPYRFEEWQTNKKIVLVRNEDYWGEKPAIKKIIFRIITDDAVAFQILKKGELDFSNLRPIQWMRQTDSTRFNQIFSKYKYLLPGFNYIGWNNQSPFFNDKKVRRAMTMMVDRQRLLEKIEFGLGQVIESPFFVEAPQYDTSLKNIAYDPEKAKALLKEAGWADTDGDGILDKDGKKFSFVFLYPAASKFSERLAPILKEDLAKVGIEMTIDRMEWAVFLERIEKKNFDATALGWSTGYEDDPYQVWHSSQAKMERGSNFISFENSEADHFIESARTEFDPTLRNKLYDRFQEIIFDEQPYTFLFSTDSLVVVSKRFKNVIVHKTGLNTLEWKIE